MEVIEEYKVKVGDLPLCEFRVGRIVNGATIMACRKKEYIEVNAFDCIECSLNC